jgi:hypothetical protein
MFSKRLLALARSSNLALTLTIVLGFLGGLLTILQETGFPARRVAWLARQLRPKWRFQAWQTCQVWEMVNEQAPGIPVGASAV